MVRSFNRLAPVRIGSTGRYLDFLGFLPHPFYYLFLNEKKPTKKTFERNGNLNKAKLRDSV